ncbi:carboxymuconolactone decarboxylase family protein [Nocardioides pocheonensis]|uniref:Carboxymuconolactone decarboxylase family protein n=1 Tax=Nocardioides pocheonensis TaxID=661485 RepID=A0A3N0GJ76_9ACTN|nr:carboxymuconolactone decarboxylase family protein [Nocardioides pocheonensis]RNM12168.1 carboxymuconolactone decarboxylase family protein [Nocardioides pocheonensis]
MNESLKAMQAEMGEHVVEAHAQYATVDEELYDAYLAWRSAMLDSGTIPRKDKLLMVIALLTAQRDIMPLKLYAQIARSQGATAQELKEALRVGILFSGGAGVDAASSVVDLLVD